MLEKVLAQSKFQVEEIESIIKYTNNAWINTSRRSMNWHKTIKEYINDIYDGHLYVEVYGGNWGLACNAIHFIDLVNWWNASDISSIETSKLNEWFPSKRKSFMEVNGQLEVNYSNNNKLIMKCENSNNNHLIKVDLGKDSLLIDEQGGYSINSNKEVIRGRCDLQSELTNLIVSDILINERCELPLLYESAKSHKILLQVLLEHWQISNSNQDKCVPIT